MIFLQQEDPAAKVDGLLRQIRSDRIEERDAATAELRKLDASVLPRLRAALEGAEPEVRERIREAIAVITVSVILTPELRKAIPSLAEELSKGPPHSWAEAFLRVADRSKFADLERADLDCLVVRALRGARAGAEQIRFALCLP